MLRVVAIGDVHADWERFWAAMKHAEVIDQSGNPNGALLAGMMRLVCIGDFVHPKSIERYENISGRSPFDFKDRDHLRSASRAQVRQLQKLKAFADVAGNAAHFILGNHDDSALHHGYKLGTAGGINNAEFDPAQGGSEIPEDLWNWMYAWVREVIVQGVHFAHAGPLPSMASFDDFFYGDHDTKHWWLEKPFLMQETPYKFGVYGHTVMKDGIYIDENYNFAMIDALETRQYLTVDFDDWGGFSYNIVEF